MTFLHTPPTAYIPIKRLVKYCSPLKLLANQYKRGRALEMNCHNSISFNPSTPNFYHMLTYLHGTYPNISNQIDCSGALQQIRQCLFGNFLPILHICHVCISTHSYTVETIPAKLTQVLRKPSTIKSYSKVLRS